MEHVSVDDITLVVTGQKSGEHQGDIRLSDDGVTFIFKPESPFLNGEHVQVNMIIAREHVDYQFHFFISPYTDDTSRVNAAPQDADAPALTTKNRSVTRAGIPSTFPQITVLKNGDTAPGFLFLNEFQSKYFLILNNDGNPLYFYQSPDAFLSQIYEFTLQHNFFTYVWRNSAALLDFNCDIIERLQGGHGHDINDHEFQVLPNGHVLLIVRDVQPFERENLPPLFVHGDHFQELDKNRDVIFEWRCWDFFQIPESAMINPDVVSVDLIHMNSLDVDFDGAYIVSCRNLDQIIKVNQNSGDIEWRFGGSGNQFYCADDPNLFSSQHDVRAVPNTPHHYTLFDNGIGRTPPYSRAVEYKLDLNGQTAETIWQYDANQQRLSLVMGSVQRLPNGNTLIGWSGAKPSTITEVTPDNEVVYEAAIEGNFYRARRYPWDGHATKPLLMVERYPDKIALFFNQFNDPSVEKYYIYADTFENHNTLIDSTTNTYIYLTGLKDQNWYYFKIKSRNRVGHFSDYSHTEQIFVNYTEPGENLIQNGDFSQQDNFWQFSQKNPNDATFEVDAYQRAHIHIQSPSLSFADIELRQENISLVEGRRYQLAFEAFADRKTAINVKIGGETTGESYARIGNVALSPKPTPYRYEFVMEVTDDEAQLNFGIGRSEGDIYLDNISLKQIDDVRVNAVKTIAHPLTLYPGMPNPFNSSTTIQYDIAGPGQVDVTIYNILGQVVEKTTYRHSSAGMFRHRFAASLPTSALYICRVVYETESDQFVQSIKLMHVK